MLIQWLYVITLNGMNNGDMICHDGPISWGHLQSALMEEVLQKTGKKNSCFFLFSQWCFSCSLCYLVWLHWTGWIMLYTTSLFYRCYAAFVSNHMLLQKPAKHSQHLTILEVCTEVHTLAAFSSVWHKCYIRHTHPLPPPTYLCQLTLQWIRRWTALMWLTLTANAT